MDIFDNAQGGERLRHLRCVMDISTTEMADSLGVTTGHFRKWERGQHAISLEALYILHRQYGMDLNYLITGMAREQDLVSAFFDMTPEEIFFMMHQLLENCEKMYRERKGRLCGEEKGGER